MNKLAQNDEKKISFIIPTYKANKWFQMNFDNWLEMSKYVELIIVEDDMSGSCEEIAKDLGARYYKKSNGNWGSVINFVKKNKLVNTDYVAIVDPDDKINILELKKLISVLGEFDLYYTNYTRISFQTNEEKLISLKKIGKSYLKKYYPFIHSLWFRTKILYDLPDLPENVIYSDGLIDLFFLSNSRYSLKYYDFAPYMYFVGIPGQSISIKRTKANIQNFNIVLKLNDFIADFDNKKRNKISRHIALRRYKSLYGYTNDKFLLSQINALAKKTAINNVSYLISLLSLKSHRLTKTIARKKMI